MDRRGQERDDRKSMDEFNRNENMDRGDPRNQAGSSTQGFGGSSQSSNQLP
ncbi:hypothetical protein J6590_074246 [Homalodisca vitripennis]|nr:hypothetical protein J6590_074246 [Homalodisca vitripennis]